MSTLHEIVVMSVRSLVLSRRALDDF